MNAWRANPLVWGHGPRVFEVFLEPTCPFSVKAFGNLEDLLDRAGEDRITVKVRLQSQPSFPENVSDADARAAGGSEAVSPIPDLPQSPLRKRTDGGGEQQSRSDYPRSP
jgi:hypothetical protein